MNNPSLDTLNKHIWPDVVRIVAIFSVVLLHSSAPFVYVWRYIPISWWKISNTYCTAGHIGVPLFIMLSGSLLLGKEESTIVFFKKRFRRVIIPFMFWILIFVLFKHYYDMEFYHRDFQSLKKIIYSIYAGDLYYHLYFINILLGLYLLVPIIRKSVKDASSSDFIYLIVLWFLFASIIPSINSLLNTGIDISSYHYKYVPFFTGLWGYFLLGYVITLYNFPKYQLIIAAFAFIVGLFVATSVSYILMLNRGGNTGQSIFLEGDISPIIIINSVSAFAIIKSVVSKYSPNLSIITLKIIGVLSRASYGVYFIHVIVLRLLQDGVFGLKIHGIIFNPVVAIPITAISTLILSYASILLLMKIPIVKNFIT